MRYKCLLRGCGTEEKAMAMGILSRHKQARKDMTAMLRPAGRSRSAEEAKDWKWSSRESEGDSWLRKVANRCVLGEVPRAALSCTLGHPP